ncbi:MAG: nucleotidyltransferase [Alphaproteobacteria bacterium]|nr:nucleotidyltransferase [Alphaproteobacteria bacterium]
MEYTDQQLKDYASRIKLSAEKKSSYAGQIDTLKANVLKAVKGMPNAKVTKVKQAGSWKKGTALTPKGDRALDIDLVFFLEVEKFDAEELRKTIIDVLCAAYPNKSRDDFTDGKKTVGVVFRGTGLEVDIVPFVPDKGNSTYGLQPRKKLNSGEFRTSVEKQLQFIKDIKGKSAGKFANFTAVVCILKTWRNYQELELPSFSIELVVAHLICTKEIDSSTSIAQALVLCLGFLGRGSVSVYFSGAIGVESDDEPWIADPTNNENNTLNLSSEDWKEIVDSALQGFETLSYAAVVAEAGKTLELWKEVLGPNFSI